MTEIYSPAVGDRVRATRTIEGVVTLIQKDSHLYDAYVGVVNDNGFRFELHEQHGWSFEKLPDPEPEWVNGDVILIIGEAGKRTPMIYCAVGEFAPPHKAVWACSECSQGWHLPASVSEDWRSGDVEILYKANAA